MQKLHEMDEQRCLDQQGYDESRPSGALVLSEIVEAVSGQFEIVIGKRHDERVNFRIGDKAWFMVHVQLELFSVASEMWRPGLFNWNGKWKVELQMGAFGNRTKKWRPEHERRATMITSVVETIQLWISDYAKPQGVIGP